MLEIIEVSPLPQRCQECQEAKEAEAMGLTPDAYCYNCDFALDRFQIEEIFSQQLTRACG